MTPASTALDGATVDRLLDATEQLLRQFGTAKTSMADVARAAGVSRGTLYRYFDSRETLLAALSHRTADRFFADVGAAMDACPSLSEQLGRFSENMIRALHPPAEGPRDAQPSLIRMLATEGAEALRRTAKFLTRYLEDARRRGEVAPDLDVADAGEWLARMLLSFTVFQASVAYRAEDPAAVSAFVRRYAIAGLTGH